jgi:hypothetical protein
MDGHRQRKVSRSIIASPAGVAASVLKQLRFARSCVIADRGHLYANASTTPHIGWFATVVGVTNLDAADLASHIFGSLPWPLCVCLCPPVLCRGGRGATSIQRPDRYAMAVLSSAWSSHRMFPPGPVQAVRVFAAASLGLVAPFASARAVDDRPSVVFIVAPTAHQVVTASVPVSVQATAKRLKRLSLSLTGSRGSEVIAMQGPWSDSDRVSSASISGTLDAVLIPYNGLYTLSATAESTSNESLAVTIENVAVEVAPDPVQGQFEVDLTKTGLVQVYTNVIGCSFPQLDITDSIQRSVDGGPYETIASVPWSKEYDDLSAPKGSALLYRLVASRPGASSQTPVMSAPSTGLAPDPSPHPRLACTGPPEPYFNNVAVGHLADPASTSVTQSPPISVTAPTTTSPGPSTTTLVRPTIEAPGRPGGPTSIQGLSIPALVGIAVLTLVAALTYVYRPRKHAK